MSSTLRELEEGAIPLVTVPDDAGSAVGARFTINPDAIKYLQSIQTKVRSAARPARSVADVEKSVTVTLVTHPCFDDAVGSCTHVPLHPVLSYDVILSCP